MPTRRTLAASLAGAVFLTGSGVDARRSRRKSRRPHHRPPQMFADDVVVNFRNRSGQPVQIGMHNSQQGTLSLGATIRSGEDSGYNYRMPTSSYRLDLWRYFLPAGSNETCLVWCENHEVGVPDVTILRGSYPGGRWNVSRTLADNVDISEDTSLEVNDGGLVIHVERQRDGKIGEDGYDEEYCRFIVTLSRK